MLRTRLLDQLGRVFDTGMALISAPAGFGKTVLLSSWAARSGLCRGAAASFPTQESEFLA